MKTFYTLLILLFPFLGFGQDSPLVEKKITTDKMIKLDEKKLKNERRKNRKFFVMKPKNQIGYLTNFFSHPFGGINYFNHFSNRFGIYIDYRPSANAIHPANYTNYYDGDENITNYGETLWASVFNVGISLCKPVSFSFFLIFGSVVFKEEHNNRS